MNREQKDNVIGLNINIRLLLENEISDYNIAYEVLCKFENEISELIENKLKGEIISGSGHYITESQLNKE